MMKVFDFKTTKMNKKQYRQGIALSLLFFILNLSIISCGEEINSSYNKIELPQLTVTNITVNKELVTNTIAEQQTFDITSNIEIKFNSSVSRSSLYKGISCKTGENKAYVYLYVYKNEDGDLIKLIPYYPFIPYVRYSCKITQEVTNIYDEVLDKEYEFSFKTNANYYSEKTFNPNYYSYDNIYVLLQRRCSDCHNENHELNLKKDKKELYDYLTQTKSKDNKFYVKANDSENSYLLNKLMGIDFYGDKMPTDQEVPLYELEKIIGWIRTGAEYEKN